LSFEVSLSCLDLAKQCQVTFTMYPSPHAPPRADTGIPLFAVTRTQRSSANDSDRLCKYVARFDYLTRFDLDWARMRERAWVNIQTKAHNKARVDARRADGEQ
jgi:sigma54-dependent transcription regulator